MLPFNDAVYIQTADSFIFNDYRDLVLFAHFFASTQ